MLIKALVENTVVSDEFKGEHGLSLYIEANGRKLLFDLGASNYCIENAKKLKVDLSGVELVVISHGHHDHGGGLKEFLRLNTKAKIYVQRHAFDKHFSHKPNGEEPYIGLEQELLPNNRFIFTDNYLCIHEGLELFSDIQGKKLLSVGNQNLLMEKGTERVRDDFTHEQNLLITEGQKKLLIAGCAHKGIVNIVDHVSELQQEPITHVIGGFHLYSPPTDKYEDPQLIRDIGATLNNTGAQYYTCHCTGLKPYEILKEVMGAKIDYLATGRTLVI